MTFGLSMHSVDRTTTYDDAVAMYNKAKAWRGDDPDGERPLPGKRNHNYGVRMDGTDVVFRYYYTDVVRRHEDGSYTLDTGGYSTGSTCAFARHFMPAGHGLQGEAYHLYIEGITYPLSGSEVTVSADGVPNGSGLGVFVKRTVNRKASKELLQSLNYPAYRDWYNVMAPMMRDSMPPQWHLKFVWFEDIKEMLACPDKWHDLFMSQRGTPAQIRECVYETCGYGEDIWNYEKFDYVTDASRLTVESK